MDYSADSMIRTVRAASTVACTRTCTCWRILRRNQQTFVVEMRRNDLHLMHVCSKFEFLGLIRDTEQALEEVW